MPEYYFILPIIFLCTIDQGYQNSVILKNLHNFRYIVFMSGLNLASKTAEHWFSLHLLLEWVAGATGTSSYQENLSKIVRVIIAGEFQLGMQF